MESGTRADQEDKVVNRDETAQEKPDTKEERDEEIYDPFDAISSIRFGLISKALQMERNSIKSMVDFKEKPGNTRLGRMIRDRTGF